MAKRRSALTKTKQMPEVVAALLCERVLEERDKTLSLIRIIDKVTLTVGRGNVLTGPDRLAFPFDVEFVVVVVLRARKGLEGSHDLHAALISPSGQKYMRAGIRLTFPTADALSNNIVQTRIKTTELGKYRVEVSFSGQQIATIPLEIVLEQSPL